MNAICLNCTLKRSPEPSNGEAPAEVVMSALREDGVQTEAVRLADYRIEPGVVSEAIVDGDEWPEIRARIVAADILVMATPTWIGQPSSIAKRALERMDAFLYVKSVIAAAMTNVDAQSASVFSHARPSIRSPSFS
jgi:multimeric flavodoxin WrbA